MKLINEDLNNEIIFEENKVNLLVVENKKKFVEFIQEIIKQINGNEGKFFLFDKNTELKMAFASLPNRSYFLIISSAFFSSSPCSFTNQSKNCIVR